MQTDNLKLTPEMIVWKKLGITSCTMEFSCGGDSMNDYTFRFYTKNKSKITSSSNNLPIPFNENDRVDLSIENEGFETENVDFFKEFISFFSNKINSFNYPKLNKLLFKKTSLILVNHLPLFIQFQDFRI